MKIDECEILVQEYHSGTDSPQFHLFEVKSVKFVISLTVEHKLRWMAGCEILLSFCRISSSIGLNPLKLKGFKKTWRYGRGERSF